MSRTKDIVRPMHDDDDDDDNGGYKDDCDYGDPSYGVS
jgi:hypothetical protein